LRSSDRAIQISIVIVGPVLAAVVMEGSQMSTRDAWTPRSPEDRLLQRYWRSTRGILFVEVPIGGPGGPGRWPRGCTTRRLDGVRIRRRGRNAGIYRFRPHRSFFEQELNGRNVELIEVKLWLDRYVIGQAIAGRAMFKRQYRIKPSCVVILCSHGDSALKWVCEREGIVVRRLRT
jgi:hypothetical protein